MNLRKQINERPWILAIGVALAVLLWMLSGSFGPKSIETSKTIASGTGQAGALMRVQVRNQVAEPVVRYISVYGQTQPLRTVELNSETEGRVESIGAERGHRLNKGDIILRLDMRDRNAQLEQTRASVNQHRTAYRAQLELQSQSYVSETQIAETLAKLETAKADLTRAKLDLEYMVIRAPFDGVLQERDVEIGDFVRAGDPVATFVDNTSIIVSGTISEQDAGFIKVNDIGQATLATGQKINGHIRYISPVADQSTRTFSVELEVPNEAGDLPAGVTAEMQLPGGSTMAQKISPSLLTLDAGGVVGVKVLDELNRVVFYPVDLAVSKPDGVWVTGLPETARIITVGQGYAAVDQEVEPVFEKADTALAKRTSGVEQMQ
jgi:multidrug efflux system membrane fusion protein